MNTSETVKAAQRLLAEREAVGLRKYGTTVDRNDLGAGDWLQHAIEEASDLLLYLIRLQQTMRQGAEFRLHRRAVASGLISESQPTPVTDFNLYTSPDVWTSQPAPAAEPTLRDDVERIRAVFAELPREHLDAAMDRLRAEREEDPEEDPPPAAAPEDAERAAYLARWKDAPEWADYRTIDGCGRVRWWPAGPLACEPRPVQGVEP